VLKHRLLKTRYCAWH